MKTLVVGWGNPIAGDDAVGLRAADAVAERLVERSRNDVDVIATSHGGFRLAEQTLGYDTVVVLDAHVAPDSAEDISITRVTPRELERPSATRHDGSLIDAFRALNALEGERLPTEILLMSVPIEAPSEWSEALSADAEEAAAGLARAALRKLEGIAIG